MFLNISGSSNGKSLTLNHLVAVEAKARVEDFWKKMNSGLPAKTPKFPMNKPSSTVKQKASKKTPVSIFIQTCLMWKWIKI